MVNHSHVASKDKRDKLLPVQKNKQTRDKHHDC
jgi:hypothetical protein